MPNKTKGVNSRVLLKRLRDTLADEGDGQERLDRIVRLIASSMKAEVCSIYLKRDELTLELCASEGLKADSVHLAKLRVGQGLVGKIAQTAEPINTSNAQQTKGFRYIPETGEENYTSFLGVAIQRLGETLGVLIVQNISARKYSKDEIYGLEIIAMVLAEMTELGAFKVLGELPLPSEHKLPFFCKSISGQEGIAIGKTILHEPNIVIENPIADNPKVEKAKLSEAFKKMQSELKGIIDKNFSSVSGEYIDIFEAYQMFAKDKGWRKRMESAIDSGLAAAVAVEKEQSDTRTKMSRVADPYIKERLHDLDDLSNRLIRILTQTEDVPSTKRKKNSILVARNIGPGELLDYGKNISGIVLEEGSVGSHATIVARSLSIPMVVQAKRVTIEAVAGDPIIIDGNQGIVHLRPQKNVLDTYKKILANKKIATQAFSVIRNLPAISKDKETVELFMNAGLMADLPSLKNCGADGVGLFRTELQFLTRTKLPKRMEQADLYAQVLDSAGGKPVIFRTVDIGSDKVLPFIKRQKEPNPALGWRAIRLGLDRKSILKVQLQALIRGAKGRSLKIMFPFIATLCEFECARDLVLLELENEKNMRHNIPKKLEIGAMLEIPSLAFAPTRFFELTDFVCIGGNDLKQFYFAADRENEQVRKRYDSLDLGYLEFIENIIKKCNSFDTPISFCGEDAGKPLEALALSAIGLRALSMRPASIGSIKNLIRSASLSEVYSIIMLARSNGEISLRDRLTKYLKSNNVNYL